MGQMILGLDIGQSSIKGVRLSKGFRGLRLVDVFVHPILRDDSSPEPGHLSSGQIEALEILIGEGKILQHDLIALSLPGDLISFREMTFPFSDPKKLEKIVPFEIESELPFDLDELTIDYMALKNRAQMRHSESEAVETRGSNNLLLIAAIQNSILSNYLEQLQPLGIDPAWVGPNALALYSYAQYFIGLGSGIEHEQDEVLVVNIGSSRTVLCSIYGGALKWIRTITIGGDLLTDGLKRGCKLTREEAETQKKALDLSATEPNSEEEKEIAALESVIKRWMMEIEKTVRINYSGPQLEKNGLEKVGSETAEDKQLGKRLLHLCGGGSELKGLQKRLSNRLEMQPLYIDDKIEGRAASVSGINLVENNLISSVYAEAFGVAFQESDGPPINFRKGLFVFGKETIERRHHFVTIGVIGLILLCLLGGNFYLRYTMKEQRYQGLKTALRTTFSETFPKIRNVINEVDQTRTAITQLKKRADFLGANEKSPLLVLKEITEAIPEDVKIDVFNVVIDSGKVSIQAHTTSFESVDRIRGGLLNTKQFKGVEVSDAKVMADQKKVRFRIKMNIVTGQ